MPELSQVGEFKLIRELSRGISANASIIKGIGDDAAVTVPGSPDLCNLFTVDMLIENIHFRRSQPPELVGRKALSVSLSDIAAMGGRPGFCLVSLGLPADLDLDYARALYRGLRATARRWNCTLIGGDTNRSLRIIISVSVSGTVRSDRAVYRSGAKPGDQIFITGSIGAGPSGRHLRFSPRLKESAFLTENFSLNAMIDVSDGLFQDLSHILEASFCGAVIDPKRIPLAKGAGSLEKAAAAGEDFELLFTLSPDQGDRLMKDWPFPRVRLSRIGSITAGRGLSLSQGSGRVRKIKPQGFSHFKPGRTWFE